MQVTNMLSIQGVFEMNVLKNSKFSMSSVFKYNLTNHAKKAGSIKGETGTSEIQNNC